MFPGLSHRPGCDILRRMSQPNKEAQTSTPDPLLLLARVAVGLAADFLERAASVEGAANEAAELLKAVTGKSLKTVDFRTDGQDFFTVQIPADKMRLFRGLLDHYGARSFAPTSTLLATLDG